MRGYNFTDGVRRSLDAARQEAHRLGSPFVAPEHILLGMLAASDGVILRIFQRTGVDPVSVRAALESRIQSGNPREPTADLPYTSASMRVLEAAMDEAESMRHYTLDTDHMLLGLLASDDSAPADVLIASGLTAAKIRTESQS